MSVELRKRLPYSREHVRVPAEQFAKVRTVAQTHLKRSLPLLAQMDVVQRARLL